MNHSFNTTVAELYGLQEAILLENIYFWCKKNEANNKLTEGEPWTYNTVKAFNTQFKYLSPAVITRALKNLEKEGLIKVGEFNTNAYDHTKWYCITDKCRKYFEDESSKKEPESHPENKKSICDFSKSKTENRNSITKKEQILITDITTDNKPNINSDISSPQPSESPYKPFVPQEENSDKKVSAKRTNSGKATKNKIDKEAIDSFLNTLSEQDSLVFDKCVTSLFEFRKSQDSKFNRSSIQLTEWKYKFALFANESSRTSTEVLNTLKFALSDSWWSGCMYNPDNLIKNYDKIIFKQNKNSNKRSSTPRSYQQPRQFDENHLFL